MSREIFVFGSNLAGVHGAGSARAALEKHGAIYGRGVGLQGDSYTPDRRVKGNATPENQQNVATSVNLNGLNGENQFDMSHYAGNNSRCEQYGWHIAAREVLGDQTIVIGQVTGDQSLNALSGKSIYGWARIKIAGLRELGQGNISFKPHPLEHKDRIPQDLGAPIFVGDMNAVFKVAAQIVTFSSTAGVDAWLNGIRATADSPVSMIYRHQNDGPEKRQEWLNELSYLQFKIDEMRSGLAWEIHGQQVLDHRSRCAL